MYFVISISVWGVFKVDTGWIWEHWEQVGLSRKLVTVNEDVRVQCGKLSLSGHVCRLRRILRCQKWHETMIIIYIIICIWLTHSSVSAAVWTRPEEICPAGAKHATGQSCPLWQNYGMSYTEHTLTLFNIQNPIFASTSKYMESHTTENTTENTVIILCLMSTCFCIKHMCLWNYIVNAMLYLKDNKYFFWSVRERMPLNQVGSPLFSLYNCKKKFPTENLCTMCCRKRERTVMQAWA